MKIRNAIIMEIPTKEELTQKLQKSFQETIDWIEAQPEDHFNKEILPGKWTIAGHLYHLIKSTKGVSKGMGTPKLGLRTMFGKNNRPERTYVELVEKYETTLATTPITQPNNFQAEPGRIFERAALIKRFEDELNDFIKALDKWKEEDMSIYVMPHPAIGKCTIREFTYFTILHTYHHLNILKGKYGKAS